MKKGSLDIGLSTKARNTLFMIGREMHCIIIIQPKDEEDGEEVAMVL